MDRSLWAWSFDTTALIRRLGSEAGRRRVVSARDDEHLVLGPPGRRCLALGEGGQHMRVCCARGEVSFLVREAGDVRRDPTQTWMDMLLALDADA